MARSRGVHVDVFVSLASAGLPAEVNHASDLRAALLCFSISILWNTNRQDLRARS